MKFNCIGLVGILAFLQVVDCLELNMIAAACLIVLGIQKRAVYEKLVRKNVMEELTDRQFVKEFRFSKEEVVRVIAALQWPPFFRLQSRLVFSSELCLLMVLYRFAFPSTLNKLEVMFGIPSTTCSIIVNHGIKMLKAKFGERLRSFDVELVLRNIHWYQESISKKSGGAATTCFGFIDGTLVQVSRPKTNSPHAGIRDQNNIQRALYSGHKRHHGIKFQSFVLHQFPTCCQRLTEDC